MEVNENAIVLGDVTPDMTRFLMHGCYDVGAICDAHGNTQTFDANDPCFLLAVGDDEFAVMSRSGYHDPQIIVFYVDRENPERIGNARRVDAAEQNAKRVADHLVLKQEVSWEELD